MMRGAAAVLGLSGLLALSSAAQAATSQDRVAKLAFDPARMESGYTGGSVIVKLRFLTCGDDLDIAYSLDPASVSGSDRYLLNGKEGPIAIAPVAPKSVAFGGAVVREGVRIALFSDPKAGVSADLSCAGGQLQKLGALRDFAGPISAPDVVERYLNSLSVEANSAGVLKNSHFEHPEELEAERAAEAERLRKIAEREAAETAAAATAAANAAAAAAAIVAAQPPKPVVASPTQKRAAAATAASAPVLAPPAAPAVRPGPSDLAANNLNAQVLEREKQIDDGNAKVARARDDAYRAELAAHDREVAAHDEEIASLDSMNKAAAAADVAARRVYDLDLAVSAAQAKATQRRYERDMAAWEAKAKACQARDVASCGPQPTPQLAATDDDPTVKSARQDADAARKTALTLAKTAADSKAAYEALKAAHVAARQKTPTSPGGAAVGG